MSNFEIEQFDRDLLTLPDGTVVDLSTGEIVSEPEQEKPEFHVTDTRSAEWVLAHMRAIDVEMSDYDQRIAKLQKMRARAAGKVAFFEGRFGEELRVWAEAIAEQTGKRTVETEYRDLVFRKVPASLSVSDEEAAIDYAKKMFPALVTERTVFSLDKNSYKKLYTAEEPLPGVTATEEHQTFKMVPLRANLK